jgi:uncharacterized protein YjiS (DUF1127 family)
MSSIAATAARCAGAVVVAPGSAILRWWVAYTTWRIERLAIDRLEAMSDPQLKDIGLVRSQIEFAVKNGGGMARVAAPHKWTF